MRRRGWSFRDIKQDLREAIEGWGTDEDAIYTALRNASLTEKQLVSSDPVLMADLRDDLNRREWGIVLGLLGTPLEARVREATAGWGTDEASIYAAMRAADTQALLRMLNNGPLLLTLRDDLSNGELAAVLGIVADKLQRERDGGRGHRLPHADDVRGDRDRGVRRLRRAQ